MLAEIARLLQEQTFHSGEIIIREQQPGSSLYIMIEGQAQIHRQGHTRDHIQAPEIFGELSVLDAAPRSASVTAETEVKVFILGRDALYQLMSTRQEIMEGVIQVLCQRVRQAVSD